MKPDKKNAIICDCLTYEVEDLKNGLENASDNKYVIESHVCNEGRKNKLMNIKRYFMYFWVPFTLFINRKKYNRIIGWQQFFALTYCWFCSIFHTKKYAQVVALNYTYKKKNGIVGKIYHRFMKRIMESKYLDFIHVPSENYKNLITNEFNISSDKIIVTCFGISDIYDKYKNSQNEFGEYVLAIGRSNRDYDYLINEWKNADKNLIIASDTYKPKADLPKNIIILDNVTYDTQFPIIANCQFMVIPIDDGTICSGDTVLLTAMSFEKAVVVTKPSTLAEMYIKDNQNGFLVSKEPGDLASKIDKFYTEKDVVGENARRDYLKYFSRYAMGMRVAEIIK